MIDIRRFPISVTPIHFIRASKVEPQTPLPVGTHMIDGVRHGSLLVRSHVQDLAYEILANPIVPKPAPDRRQPANSEAAASHDPAKNLLKAHPRTNYRHYYRYSS